MVIIIQKAKKNKIFNYLYKFIDIKRLNFLLKLNKSF